MRAFDPQAEPVARRIFGKKITLADKSYDALKGADALVIATEWNEFREPDFPRMRKLMKTPVIFDGRNIYSPGADEGPGLHLLLRRPLMAGHTGVTHQPAALGRHARLQRARHHRRDDWRVCWRCRASAWS